MYYSVVEAACLRPYAVYLKFEDGTEGVLDLDAMVGSGGVFDLLADEDYFSRMKCDPDLRTITWPNGADLSPEVLYDKIKAAKPGQPVGY